MTHRLKRNPPPAPTRLSSLLVIGALLASCAAKVADATGQVIRVIDGDTIRLIGVDAPKDEASHPSGRVFWPRNPRLHQSQTQRQNGTALKGQYRRCVKPLRTPVVVRLRRLEAFQRHPHPGRLCSNLQPFPLLQEGEFICLEKQARERGKRLVGPLIQTEMAKPGNELRS